MRVFRKYVPEDAIPSVQYLQDDDGVDWYAAQGEFAADSLIVCTDETGRVCAFSRDASALYPIDQAVWSVPASSVPEEFDADGDWTVVDGKIAARAPTAEDAKAKMHVLLAPALLDFQALQVIVDAGGASDAERQRHEALRAYCQALYRVESQEGYPADVVWPERP